MPTQQELELVSEVMGLSQSWDLQPPSTLLDHHQPLFAAEDPLPEPSGAFLAPLLDENYLGYM